MLKERNLTPHQGVLQAIWSDERIAMSCVTINSTDQLRDNVAAARQFTPLKAAELEQLQAAALAAAPTFCPDCDGRCAAAAGTDARLGDLTRYLTYYEHHGHRDNARRQYAELTRRRARLVGRRPGSGPSRLPQPARLREVAAGGRSAPGLSRFRPSVLAGRWSVSGTNTGRLPETPETLDLGGDSNITPEVDIIPIRQVNEARERLLEPE